MSIIFTTDSYGNSFIPDAVVGPYSHLKHRGNHLDCLAGTDLRSTDSREVLMTKCHQAITGVTDLNLAFSAKGGITVDEGFGDERIQNGEGKGRKFYEHQNSCTQPICAFIALSNNSCWYENGFNHFEEVRKFLHWLTTFYRRTNIKHIILCSVLFREYDFHSEGLANKTKFNEFLALRVSKNDYPKFHSGAKLHFYDATTAMPCDVGLTERMKWFCVREVTGYEEKVRNNAIINETTPHITAQPRC